MGASVAVLDSFVLYGRSSRTAKNSEKVLYSNSVAYPYVDVHHCRAAETRPMSADTEAFEPWRWWPALR